MDQMSADQAVEFGKRVERALKNSERLAGRPLTNPEKAKILAIIRDAMVLEMVEEKIDYSRHAGLH